MSVCCEPGLTAVQNEVTVRAIRPDDLPAVIQVQRRAYDDALQEAVEVFGAKLRLAPDSAWLAEHDGRTIAYLFAHPWAGYTPPALNLPLAALPPETDCAYLHDLAVRPEARGSGVALLLIDRFERWAKERGFERSMLVAVGSAERFWARIGFERTLGATAFREKLSDYGAGAVCMHRGAGFVRPQP